MSTDPELSPLHPKSFFMSLHQLYLDKDGRDRPDLLAHHVRMLMASECISSLEAWFRIPGDTLGSNALLKRSVQQAAKVLGTEANMLHQVVEQDCLSSDRGDARSSFFHFRSPYGTDSKQLVLAASMLQRRYQGVTGEQPEYSLQLVGSVPEVHRIRELLIAEVDIIETLPKDPQ